MLIASLSNFITSFEFYLLMLLFANVFVTEGN